MELVGAIPGGVEGGDASGTGACDGVVEADGAAPGSVGGDHSAAVLKDHEAGGLCGGVLRGHVDPIVAGGSGIDFAGPGMFGDDALRDVRLPLRVGAEDVFVG